MFLGTKFNIFLRDQLKLLIWFKITITGNGLNVTGGLDLKVAYF